MPTLVPWSATRSSSSSSERGPPPPSSLLAASYLSRRQEYGTSLAADTTAATLLRAAHDQNCPRIIDQSSVTTTIARQSNVRSPNCRSPLTSNNNANRIDHDPVPNGSGKGKPKANNSTTNGADHDDDDDGNNDSLSQTLDESQVLRNLQNRPPQPTKQQHQHPHDDDGDDSHTTLDDDNNDDNNTSNTSNAIETSVALLGLSQETALAVNEGPNQQVDLPPPAKPSSCASPLCKTSESRPQQQRHCLGLDPQQQQQPIIGPNERIYRLKYERKIQHSIQQFRHDHPGVLDPAYGDMIDPAQKQAAQAHVMALLERLGIAGGGGNVEGDRISNTSLQRQQYEDVLFEVHPTNEFVIDDDDVLYRFETQPPPIRPCHSTNSNKHRHEPCNLPANSGAIETKPRSSNDLAVLADISIGLLSPTGMGLPPLASSSSSYGVVSQRTLPNLDTSFNRLSPPIPSAPVGAVRHRNGHDPKLQEPSTTHQSLAISATADHSKASFTEPIELARSQAMPSFFASPQVLDDWHGEDEAYEQHNKKRMASSSGKRGTDLCRQRVGPTPNSNQHAADNWSSPLDSPTRILRASIHRLSIAANSKIFTTSQSPISPFDSTQNNLLGASSPFLEPDISFGDDDKQDDHVDPNPAQNSNNERCHERRAANSASPATCPDVDSVEETIINHRRVRWHPDETMQWLGTKSHIGLKPGATYHLQPLPLRQQHPVVAERRHFDSTSFIDPLDSYPEREQRRLRHLSQWIMRRDTMAQRSRTTTNIYRETTGVILSLTESQSMDLILNWLFQTHEPASSTTATAAAKGDMQGNTLIVARSKQDLDGWRRSFRVGSGYSVLNHSTMPMSERKARSSVQTIAQYDVVLSTYDAMKSTDATIALDSSGYCQTQSSLTNHNQNHDADSGDGGGGWYSSRNQSQQMALMPNSIGSGSGNNNNKQLSVLHLLSWRRVVFLDVLGRKSYLVKAGTSRFVASRAVNAKARFVIFVRGGDNDDDGDGGDDNKNDEDTNGGDRLRFHDQHRTVHQQKKPAASDTLMMTAMERIINSDRDALSSVARVLRQDHRTGNNKEKASSSSSSSQAMLCRKSVVDFASSSSSWSSKN